MNGEGKDQGESSRCNTATLPLQHQSFSSLLAAQTLEILTFSITSTDIMPHISSTRALNVTLPMVPRPPHAPVSRRPS